MPDKVVQCGYMSGDMYGAASCLILYPDFHILLIKDTKESQDKTGQIDKFYKECGLTGRYTIIDISSSAVDVKDIWNVVKDKRKTNAPLPHRPLRDASDLDKYVYNLCTGYNPKTQWPRSITAVTGLVANKYDENSDTTARAIAKAWRIGKLDTDMKFSLYEFMASKFSKINFDIRKNILVLWSRQSGKRGGAHAELDSSYSGIRQLAGYFATTKGSATVLLSGDEKGTKLAEIANYHTQVINVSQMWDDPYWKNGAFAGATFLAQFAFFKYLAEKYNVIHLGMRSGMLESMALLGMKVFYLEPAPSPSGNRMLAFNQAGIPYTRIEIREPPGITAQIVNTSVQGNSKYLRTPSLPAYKGKLEQLTEQILSQQVFLRFNGVWDRRQRQYVPTDFSYQRAREFAKAKMLGQTPDYNLQQHIYEDLSNNRGFLKVDLEKIVLQIESQLVVKTKTH